jgi:hypothetical protein
MVVFFGGARPGRAAPAATTTTLAVTSAINTVAEVDKGSVVTLTETVKAGSEAVTIGQVKFCDATATYCSDIHLLGTEQLTDAGTATLRFVPGVGDHSYKAIFAGTKSSGGRASSNVMLAVTGPITTTTSIATAGSASNYTLRGTVSGLGGPQPPTGTISFLDTSSGNSVFGSAVLGSSATLLSFLNPSNPETGARPWSVAAADFNGDGVLDLAVANKETNSVTILLGVGDGTFSRAANSAVTVLRALALLVALTGGFVACGGEGSAGVGTSSRGTTAGTYTVTVTGTSNTTTATGAFTLTVQ